MKKIVVILFLMAAAGASIFYSQQSPTSKLKASGTLLEYIPADTLYFSGTLEPFPIRKAMEILGDSTSMLSGDVDTKFPSFVESPGGELLIQLANEYNQATSTPSTFFDTWGLAEEMNYAFYSIGFLPTIRFQLSDSQKFKQLIQEIETKHNIQNEKGVVGKTKYTSYRLLGNASTPNEKIDLIFSIKDNYAIFTLKTHLDDKTYLSLALGETLPGQSLANANILDDIQKQYQFSPMGIAFFNNQVLANVLTSNEASRYQSIINELTSEDLEAKQFFDQFRTPSCQKEITDVTKIWPRIVAGYKSVGFSGTQAQFEFTTTIEFVHAKLLEQLRQLQGHIPSHMTEKFDGVMATAVGFDSSKVLPVLKEIWQSISNAQYDCIPLKSMQQEIVKSNPAGVGMMMSMLAGFQGASISLVDVATSPAVNSTDVSVDSIDALITVSSTTPDTLFSTVTTLIPGMQSLRLPDDGSLVDFPFPLPMSNNQKVKIAKKGNHIAIVAGEKSTALANQLEDSELNHQGFYYLQLDYQRYFSLLVQNLEKFKALIPEEQINHFESLKKLQEHKMNMSLKFNINTHGIALDGSLTAEKAEKKVTP